MIWFISWHYNIDNNTILLQFPLKKHSNDVINDTD